MPIDKSMTYRVRIDDSDFQAKLTMMRASMDATMAGVGAASMPMMGSAAQFGYRQAFGSPGFGGGGSDIGYNMMPVSYSPATTALTPNMGQVALRQSTWQAANVATFGTPGIFTPPPSGIQLHDYMALSSRQLGDAVGRGVSTAMMATTNAAGGILGGGIGGALGGFMMGGPVGALIGGIGGSMLGSMAMDPLSSALGDRYRIEDYLANTSFRYFQGPGADQTTGRGFGRMQRNDIARFMTQQDRGDFRVNMGDIENILKFGTESGMFDGTQDIDDFKRKFTDLKDKVKRITSVLNTTASEGVQVIKQLRDIGISDTGAVFGAVHTADMLGMASGRTAMEMVAVGMQGAETFRGTGVDMSVGFRSAQMNLAQVRGALNAGLITHERIAQAGGEEALAQQMTAGSLAFAQSGQGRLMMMAGFNGSGLALNRMGGNMFDVVNRAVGTMNSPADFIRLQARQEDLLSDMGSKMGGMGLDFMQMTGLMQRAATIQQMAPGLNREDAFIMAGKQLGMSRSQIDMRMAQINNPDAMAGQLTEAASKAMVKATMEDFRDKSAMMHVSEFAKDKVASFFDPFVDKVSRIGARVGDFAESTANEFVAKNILGTGYMSGRVGMSSEYLARLEADRRASGESASRGSIATIDRTGMLFGNKMVQTDMDTAIDQMLAMEGKGTSTAAGGRRVRLEASGYEGEIFSSAEGARRAAEAMKEKGMDVNMIERSGPSGTKYILTTNQQIAEADKARDNIHVDAKHLDSAQKELPKVYSKIADFRPEWAKMESPQLEADIKKKFSALYGKEFDEKSADDRSRLTAIARQIGSPAADTILEKYTGQKASFMGSSLSAMHEKTADAADRVTASAAKLGISSDAAKDSTVQEQLNEVLHQKGDRQRAATEGLRAALKAKGMDDKSIEGVISKLTADRSELSSGVFGFGSDQDRRDTLSRNIKELIEASGQERKRVEAELLKDNPDLANDPKSLGAAIDAMLGSRGAIKQGAEGNIGEVTKDLSTLVLQHQQIIEMIRRNSGLVPRSN